MKSKLEMYELPLFPLNVVLFPGMPLPLHIFEDRYKAMVADCIRENRPFGVVLMQNGRTSESGAADEPVAVGCTAEIAQVQPLEHGRMLILTVGRERFRVVELNYEKPYLIGLVEPAPLVTDDEEWETAGAASLEPYIIDYMNKLALLGSFEVEPQQIPSDAEGLVYMAATLIQLPIDEKQSLLAIDRASDLTRALRTVYRRELALMQTIPSDDIGIFSLN